MTHECLLLLYLCNWKGLAMLLYTTEDEPFKEDHFFNPRLFVHLYIDLIP